MLKPITSNLPSFLIYFALIFIHSKAAWTQLSNQVLTMPAHVYRVPCILNQVVSGVVKWNGTADLDMFVYRDGSNVLSRSTAYKRFLSYSLDSREWFSFTVPATGIYYFRVQAYSMPYSLSYEMEISMPSSPSIMLYDGYFLNANSRMQAIKLNNSPQNRPTAIRASITGTSWITPYIASTTSSSIYSISSNTGFLCLPSTFSNGQWNVYFYHSTASNFISLATYTAIIEIDPLTTDCSTTCQGDKIWSNASSSCISPQTNNNEDTQIYSNAIKTGQLSSFMKVIIIVIGCVVGVFIIIGVAYFIRRHRVATKANIIPQEIISEQNSETNLDQKLKFHNDSCSICLQGSCNSTLSCGHGFHKQCITQWYKRNSMCPMCRKQIKIKRIKVAPAIS